MIRATTSFKKIAKLKHKNLVIQGSQGAGKTFSILLRWILKATQNDSKQYCSIVTATFPALRDGALKDFLTICSLLEVEINGTKSPAVYKVGKWTFQFFSVDKENKGLGARRDRLFINEANRMPWKIARQLINRTHVECIFDFNPVKEFWGHTQFVKPKDCDFVKLIYKDNEALPKAEVNAIEKHAPWGAVPDANFWRVYGLGEIGFTEGVIFSNTGTYDQIPSEVNTRVMYGIDFGWEDPLTCVKVSIDKKNKILYWEEIFFESHKELKDVAEVMKERGYKGESTICDNDPLNIRMLRKMGIKSMGTNKGKGLEYDIILLKQFKIMIHNNSYNLLSEMADYSYKIIETPQGTMFEPYPADRQSDHAIDAARYASCTLIGRQ